MSSFVLAHFADRIVLERQEHGAGQQVYGALPLRILLLHPKHTTNIPY